MTHRTYYLVLAAVAGLIPLASDWLVFEAKGSPDPLLSGVSLARILMSAAPFALLALIFTRSERRQLAGLGGLVVTVLPWVWLTYEGWLVQSGKLSGGANIGLGLILLAWPAVVYAFLMIAARPKQAG